MLYTFVTILMLIIQTFTILKPLQLTKISTSHYWLHFLKLQFAHIARLSKYSSQATAALPFFSNSSISIAKILKCFDFKIIFAPTNKIQFSNLNNPTDYSNFWGICSNNCQCCVFYIGQTTRAQKFRIKKHTVCACKQGTNNLVIVGTIIIHLRSIRPK